MLTGVSTGSTGDSAGNIAFGLRPEDLVLFPEIQANYDVSLGLRENSGLFINLLTILSPVLPSEDDSRLPCVYQDHCDL